MCTFQRTSNLGGLLSKEPGPASAAQGYEPVADIVSDLPEIHVPDSDINSSNSSLNSLPPVNPSNRSALWPLNNLKTEISQKWSGLKFPGRMFLLLISVISHMGFYFKF